MKIKQVSSLVDRYKFHECFDSRSLGSNEDDWFDRFESFTKSSRIFQPYLRKTKHQKWILIDQNKVIGRIAAMHPISGPGRFGLLHCINDQNALCLLLKTAEEWLAERGLNEIIGPFYPSIHEGCGLLEIGKHPVMYGYPVTPIEFISHLEQFNYNKAKKLLTFQQSDKNRLEKLRSKLSPAIKSLNKAGYRVSCARWRHFRLHSRWLNQLINECWSSNWGFEPITITESQQLLIRILTFLPAGSLQFTVREGQPVAIALGIPDARRIASKCPKWLGIVNLLFVIICLKKGPVSHGRIALLGVIPEYQSSHESLVSTFAMLEKLIKIGENLGSNCAEMGWILEDNTSMLRFLKLYGGECVMEHVIMSKEL